MGHNASLLPVGMTKVVGDFVRGDVIAICNLAGVPFARGLANYASTEARLICQKTSADFESILGFTAEPEMIHRDNLVLL
jgi:glutamate 5-kinase